jgi:hypothetical protein
LFEFLQDPIGEDGVDVTRYPGLLDRFDQRANFYEITIDGFHFTVSIAKKCTAVPEMRFHLNRWERIGRVLREYTEMNFKTYAERTGTTTTATSIPIKSRSNSATSKIREPVLIQFPMLQCPKSVARAT